MQEKFGIVWIALGRNGDARCAVAVDDILLFWVSWDRFSFAFEKIFFLGFRYLGSMLFVLVISIRYSSALVSWDRFSFVFEKMFYFRYLDQYSSVLGILIRCYFILDVLVR